MRVSESTARPNAFEIRGLVELYTTTLKSRGYGPVVVHAYVRAVEHYIAWASPEAEHVETGEASIRRFIRRASQSV